MVGSGAGFGNKFNFQLSRVRGHKFRKLGNCLAECLVMKPGYPVNFEKKKNIFQPYLLIRAVPRGRT